MKRLLLIITLTVVCASSVFSLMYMQKGYRKLYWGHNVFDVATNLVKMDVITEDRIEEVTNALEHRVEIYEHDYADPEFVWYFSRVNKWVNINFSTNVTNLLRVDKKIKFLTLLVGLDFSRLIVSSNNKGSSLIYNFYFYSNRLFAVSLRFKNEYYNQITYTNMENENVHKFAADTNVHPGYEIPGLTYKSMHNNIIKKYGGFNYRFERSFDYYTTCHYRGYHSTLSDTSLVLYYQQFVYKKINCVITYVDNIVMEHIYGMMQNTFYEPKELITIDEF